MNKRRSTPTVHVGGVAIGSDHPIRVQSMTNTDTEDVEATARQVRELADAGSELVRITVNTPEAARAVPRIRELLARDEVSVPLIGDFHYNGHQLLRDFPECARALDKYRINPGTVVGRGKAKDKNFAAMIEIALRYGKPVRIGANWGSLDRNFLKRMMDENAKRELPKTAQEILLDAMAESALFAAAAAEELGMGHDRIILSTKMSCVSDVVTLTRQLASRCDYPLHIGLTEAGMGDKGVVSSAAALSLLLADGIGDTIRVSLTPAPGESRTHEVRLCQEVLQALDVRAFGPVVIACPGCGRTEDAFFYSMVDQIKRYVDEHKSTWWRLYPGVEDMKIAAMGCVVNGPGESRHADIGISLPGKGEEPKAPVFIDRRLVTTLSGPHIVQEFIVLLDRYIKERFSQ